MRHFPAEWHPQKAIMLTWPHKSTDWKDNFDQVVEVYLDIAKHVLQFEDLIISCEDPIELKKAAKNLKPVANESSHALSYFVVPANDTWARDHGPISVFEDGQLHLLDFTFNAWGDKFNAEKDNEITASLFNKNAFGSAGYEKIEFVLEGGSIESDGQGTLLTTETCLLTDTRNSSLSKLDIESQLKASLGIDRVLWLKNGYIQGDDTDSHIDTLARFCSPGLIAFVECTDSSDIHFEALSAMADELEAYKTLEGKPYQLAALPLPKVFSTDGRRLGATYANFLILNRAVLLPVYGVAEDRTAEKVLQDCFPDRTIISINCLPLIEQNGSLHCITMQIPKEL